MLPDWLRIWPEFVRLNLQKARHARRVKRSGAAHSRRLPPSPCQSGSDTGRAHETHCEACLRFDTASLYRHVCPALRLRPEGAFCSLDSTDVRPDWRRAFVVFLLPPLVAAAFAALVVWASLRFGGRLEKLSPLDVVWPPRWAHIAEHRRAHFRDIALRAIRAGDIPAASIALFSATASGLGRAEENIALARLATLGGFFSLSDEIHTRDIAAHPEQAAARAIAWHDDLLLAKRPRELARLALAQLAAPGAPREFWLRAFFESIRHPGAAAELLSARPETAIPHAGLRHALLARDAIDHQDKMAAADQLLAFAGLPPGPPARRFLVDAWRDAGDFTRAGAAAISTAQPAPPGEIALLAYGVLRAQGHAEEARSALRPLFAEPSLRIAALAALVADPDAGLLREIAASPSLGSAPASLSALWFAARRAGDAGLARGCVEKLARLGVEIPAELETNDTRPTSRDQLLLAATVLPIDREVLYALRAPR